MPLEKPVLRLSTPEDVGPRSVAEDDDIALVSGQDMFANAAIKEAYAARLQAVRSEMVAIPGLREVTDMALERVTFFYYKMLDLESSGVLSPSSKSKLKLWFSVYEKILTGWVKLNDELYRAARQIDAGDAFKQSFISQVSAILKEHLAKAHPDILSKVADDLQKLT